jgi:hypothetical protein
MALDVGENNMLFQILFIGLAFTQPLSPATATSCGVMPPSIIGRSPAGVAQVSNLAAIRVEATVSRRLLPPSGVLQGLKADVRVYQVSPTGARTVVPASVNLSGGGGDQTTESVWFDLNIPVESAERDAAIRDYITELMGRAGASSDGRDRALAPTVSAMKPEMFVGLFRQHRIGSFRVECPVLDGDRLLGIGEVALEVLFKGRFFDQEAFRKP